MILVSKLSDRLAKAKRELDISTRQMAERAEANGYKLSDYNAKVYTSGKHSKNPDASTLEALSYVLRVPLAEVRELAGLPVDTEPFEAHQSADMLTATQRAAVNEIIRLLAEGNKGANDDRQDTPQQGTQAGSTVHSSEDGSEDGGEARRSGAPIGKDNVHHLDQGKLQPPPPAEKSVAWTPDEELEGIVEARRSRDRGEESQQRPDGDE